MNLIFKICAKDTIKKVKRHPTEWEKTYTNHISSKGLVYWIYKEILQLNNRKKTTQVEKWSNGLTRNFSKEDIKMVNKQMKRCSTSFVTWETQIKTMRHLFTPTRMTLVNKQKTESSKCLWECGESGGFIHC